MIVVCGEALVDVVPARDGGPAAVHPGGSAANVAVALGRLGVDVMFLTRLSTDHYGQRLRAHLTGSRVQLPLAVLTDEPTTVATVSLDRYGDAEYTFDVDGTTNGGWPLAELPKALPPRAALHVSGSFALAVPALGDTIDVLLHRERGRRVIALDPNPRAALTADPAAARTRLEHWLPLADIVKLSAEDLRWAAPGESMAEVARRWRRYGSALVVVTRGGEGVYAAGPAGELGLPANPVLLADTVGAGDAFMAGLLAALDRSVGLSRPRLDELTGDELTGGLRYAQRVAAVTCGRPGADPPWRSEL